MMPIKMLMRLNSLPRPGAAACGFSPAAIAPEKKAHA
jgi:hypothetical protein